jgi:hypothetical protein
MKVNLLDMLSLMGFSELKFKKANNLPPCGCLCGAAITVLLTATFSPVTIQDTQR